MATCASTRAAAGRSLPAMIYVVRVGRDEASLRYYVVDSDVPGLVHDSRAHGHFLPDSRSIARCGAARPSKGPWHDAGVCPLHAPPVTTIAAKSRQSYASPDRTAPRSCQRGPGSRPKWLPQVRECWRIGGWEKCQPAPDVFRKSTLLKC